MQTFIISDLHLMDREEAFLFNRKKEIAFCALVENVLRASGQLILAGDIFDFTGLTPCLKGQVEFFREACPDHSLSAAELAKLCRSRTTEELLLDIKEAFPDFFTALAALAHAGRLCYIPGNHDCDFLNPEAQAIFAKVLAVPANRIRWQNQFVVDQKIIVAHGNEFDPPNNTARGCANPGFTFTSALYGSVLPALKMLNVDALAVAAIPAVRPEEATVTGLQYHLGGETCQRVLLAFVRLLQRNGFFTGLAALPAWFITKHVPIVSTLFRRGVTTKRVARLLPKEKLLIASGRDGAKKLRARATATDAALLNATVVLGHTHEFDLQPGYVNLGTWIDHITGLHPVEITAADSNLAVFVLNENGTTHVYNIEDLQRGDDLFRSPILTGGLSSSRNETARVSDVPF
jgi:UDP-2,3-diacylglucosamine pyrophosphatase LpxH